jgi:Zn finger protein HypA/HybF involved in hydrogenase expression
MQCLTCKTYFKQDAWNQTNQCDNCADVVYDVDNDLYQDLDSAERMELMNPSGVTRPVFYD